MAAAGFVAAFILVVMLGVTVLAIGTRDSTESTGTDVEAAAGAASGQTIVATEFAFAPPITEVTGLVEITLVNDGAAFHNLEIEGVDGFIIEVEASESATASIDLAAGDYVLFCSVPGHREAGMESALIVT